MCFLLLFPFRTPAFLKKKISGRLFGEFFGCSKEKSSSKSLILISCLNATRPFRHVQLHLQSHETHSLHSRDFQLSLVFSALIQSTIINLFSLSLLPWCAASGADANRSMHYQPVCMWLWKQHIKHHLSSSLHIECGSICSLLESNTVWPTLMGKRTPLVQTTHLIYHIHCLFAHDEQALLSSVKLLSSFWKSMVWNNYQCERRKENYFAMRVTFTIQQIWPEIYL